MTGPLAKVCGFAARCAERLCLSGVGSESESRLRLVSGEAQPRMHSEYLGRSGKPDRTSGGRAVDEDIHDDNFETLVQHN